MDALIGLGYGDMMESVLQTIGDTPLVRLNKLCASRPDVKVYAKLEGFNPTGSIKDRIALSMIEQAEADGILKPGSTIIEATSGNTGIGMAMVGVVKGYHVVAVMCEGVSVERRKFLAAFGAELVLTPAKEGTDGAIRKCRELVQANPDKYVNLDQFANKANVQAHYDRTAVEIWEQTNHKITHFVATVGTSGTLGGTGARLKEFNPWIHVVEVQPELGHDIQGLKSLKEAIVPDLYPETKNVVSQQFVAPTHQAFALTRKIVLEEGIFVGTSSGAALAGVLEILPDVPPGSVIVTIFPDRGEKYLTTTLFPYTDPAAGH